MPNLIDGDDIVNLNIFFWNWTVDLLILCVWVLLRSDYRL